MSHKVDSWKAGQTVRIGFMTLTVVGRIATPRDYRPDEWLLSGTRGSYYVFTPYNGIERALDSEVPHLLDMAKPPAPIAANVIPFARKVA